MKIILLLFIPFVAFSQRDVLTEPLSNWSTFPPISHETAQSYNMGNPDWTVFLNEGEIYATSDRGYNKNKLPFEIKVKKNEQELFWGMQSILEVNDGYLVGYSRGEWGGDLWWFSKDGKERDHISDDIIVDIWQQSNKIYAIEGLAHLSLSSGSIIEISKVNEQWTANAFIELDNTPEAVDLYQDEFIIITSNDLIQVDNQKNIKRLIEDGFWTTWLNPTSLVIKDNIAFMGMRKGVFTYNLETGEQKWLMRNEE